MSPSFSSTLCPQKGSQMFFVCAFFAIILKLFTNFHQIWQVAAAVNAEQQTWSTMTVVVILLYPTMQIISCV